MSLVIPLWKKCLDELKYQLKENQFALWIRPLSIQIEGQTLVAQVPNDLFAKEIQKDYLSLIQDAVNKYSDGEVTDVVIRVGSIYLKALEDSNQPQNNSNLNVSLKNDLAHEKTNTVVSNSLVSNHSVNQLPMTRTISDVNHIPLTVDNLDHDLIDLKSLSYIDQKYTFDKFVAGKSNNLAYKACLDLTKRNPQHQHNPLFIYGSSGLGKTHLMHAVAHKYVKANRSFYYFTSDKFVNQMVYALRSGKIDDFKKKIQKVDLLIIDDIHVLAGKTKTTTEFLSLFADFTSGDKQLILASDRHPAQLKEFDERFRSRLSGGLSVAVEPPEIDTRMQILQKKASQLGIELSKDCALFIAQNVVSNVRRLEGALNQVMANANLTGEAITIEMVQYALKDILAMRVQAVNMDNIRKVVAEYYELSVKDLMGKKRNRNIARPRQIAMALSRELTKNSFPDIGQSFGGRDHSTVMHACDKVAQLRQEFPLIDKEYKALALMLQAG